MYTLVPNHILIKILIVVFNNKKQISACGKTADETKLWTHSGMEIKYAPWNVFIQHIDYDGKRYIDWCQGSLISSNLVISCKYTSVFYIIFH